MFYHGRRKIAVVGLGYVGLPLALEFGKQLPSIGYDIDPLRVNQLIAAYDANNDVSIDSFYASSYVEFTCSADKLADADTFIVTVPTPVDDGNRPDLTQLKEATKLVGKYLKKGDLVVFESTVYPGATEEICIPILCETSKLYVNIDFGVGYSPERINPGDKERSLADIIKVTSGSNKYWADETDELYKLIIKAGTHKASSIKVAEASKVIENTQRDVNIALMNQLAQIFSVLNIDTNDVIDAAKTKWNFLPFNPGLVGGHCIGVDPYYLTHKAESVGYLPDLILTARRINNGMSKYVVSELVRLMAGKHINIVGARILLLGISFKENCRDIRNSRVIDIISELNGYNFEVDVFDPVVDHDLVEAKVETNLIKTIEPNSYDAAVLCVKHSVFLSEEFANLLDNAMKNKNIIFDLKGVLDKNKTDRRL